MSENVDDIEELGKREEESRSRKEKGRNSPEKQK